jgi:thiopeptide-type bacteriocin biosynthesis protein
MSDFKVDSFLLLRSPAYSYTLFNEAFLLSVLETDFFRAAIFLASQTLHKELKKRDFDYNRLSPNLKFTLWKYLNRMCFRPLPYGLFSSYSVVPWAESKDDSLFLDNKGSVIIHPDFEIILEHIKKIDVLKLSTIKYYPNNSLYDLGGNIRFLTRARFEKKGGMIMQVKSIPGLKKFLKGLRGGRTKSEILKTLELQFVDIQASAFFESLKDAQVIVSELSPNVTGESYNGRCMEVLSGCFEAGVDVLRSFNVELDLHSRSLPSLEKCIQHLIRNGIDASYALFNRKVFGGINKEIQLDIIKLVKALNRLTGDKEADLFAGFRQDFFRKYDLQEVPLMIVLDPEFGIGYKDLAKSLEDEHADLIQELRGMEEGIVKTQINWGPLEQMIFQKWKKLDSEYTEDIVLTKEDLQNLPASHCTLPPGLFVLFRNIDENLWIDSIGGVSGVELSSRFAIDSYPIEEGVKRICEVEQTINNDFIFAEIAFSPDDKAANVNRRGHCYAYEIPINTYSVRPQEYIINLDDLMLSVAHGRILLRSKRLNRFIIPRLSSAYNYQLSSIPVFRFLCDLQFQGVKSNFTFALCDLFPGMAYYPRLQLDNVVLSPATWFIDEEKIQEFNNEQSDLIERLKIPHFFTLNEGDNFLVFRAHNKHDLSMFRRCIRNKKQVKLMEYVLEDSKDCNNTLSSRFITQMVACIINGEKSYLPADLHLIRHDQVAKVKRAFLIGQEWLYVKVFSHPSVTDEILIRLVKPIVERFKKENPEFKWFFVRYQDPSHHLRLRFFVGKNSSYDLLDCFLRKVKETSRSIVIQNVTVDSYEREIEKYSAECIAEVESFFYSDSEFILKACKVTKGSFVFKLAFAVNTTLRIIEHFIEDRQAIRDFLIEILTNISCENDDIRSKLSRKLDLKYRASQIELVLNNISSIIQNSDREYAMFSRHLKDLQAKIEGWENKLKSEFLINIIHVHINRIFENDQREYERIIYHFMNKHYLYISHVMN